MQLAIDPLRKGARDARRAREIVDARGLNATQTAEVRKQRLALLASDSGDVLQRGRRACLRPPGAMTLDRETVRFVANLLQKVQARVVGRKRQRRIPIREHDLLETRLPLGSLRNADQRRLVQPLL